MLLQAGTLTIIFPPNNQDYAFTAPGLYPEAVKPSSETFHTAHELQWRVIVLIGFGLRRSLEENVMSSWAACISMSAT